MVAVDVGAGNISGGKHKSIHDPHFDVVVCQFGTVGDVFGGEKAGGQMFNKGFTVCDPFDLKARGEGEVEKDTGMTEPEMDSKFTIRFGAEG